MSNTFGSSERKGSGRREASLVHIPRPPQMFEIECPECGVVLHREDFKDHLVLEHLG